MHGEDTHSVEFSTLNERVEQLISTRKIRRKSEAPIYLLLKHRFYAEEDAIAESYTDGGNDCGIDAIYIERNREQPLIHILQSKFHESTRKSRAHFKAASLEKIDRFFEIVKDRTCKLSKIANAALEQKIIEIRELTEADFPEFKVWLLSNGTPCVDHEIAPLRDRILRQKIQVEEFHLHEFIEFCINRRGIRTDHTFSARETGILEYGPSELQSLVGFISARELYGLIKDSANDQKIDYSLFDMNVRGFLGLDNNINKEIYKSALSNNNIHFSSFNNGITIIGSSIKVMRMSDQPKIGIKNISIVNGAQTCSAIFDAMKEDYPDFTKFDRLSVLFRLFATEDRDLIDKISLSTNSQNRVNPRDLKANDKTQVDLEQKLLKHGIRYIRKRGDLGQSTGDLIPLDAMRAGQIILSYVHLEPASAKRDSDNIFADNYGKIFHNVDIERLVEASRLFDLIDYQRDVIADNLRIRGAYRTENTFVTYGAFHILAVCSILKERNREIDDNVVIEKAIEIIGRVLAKNRHPAYYSFFRNPEMSRAILNEAWQPDLFD
ncbi:hypothetical protein AEM38_15560 [Hyphomonadaceae bacterium UKL13-1]|nr:hypothetical protein AEM38_15560 [Hyphomonadaceae bacterium UKL13-1]